MSDIYFWRQIFILTTTLLYSISVGYMISFPSVLNPALLAPNGTDITATSDQASWIAASNGFAGMFGLIILSPIFQIFGRKAFHIICNLLLLVGWVIFSFANNITALFGARIIQGSAIGGIYINSMLIGEYCDRKRRGYFTILKKVSTATGTLMCHASSLFWNWRQIATFAITLPTIAILLTVLWPESPSYLALKNKFKESEESFVWLHGSANMKELEVLLASQTQTIKKPNTEKWYKFFFKKDFLRPLLIVSLLTLLLALCGKYYFVVYVIDMMLTIIDDKSIAIYCSLSADILTIVALILSCFVIRYCKRRFMLFSFGVATVALMLLLCGVIVSKISVLWLTPGLMLLHCFLINIGLVPVCFAFIGEVFPLEYKGSGSCVTGIVFTLLYSFILKVTPILIEYTGVEGVFATFGICTAVCLLVLYFILPETKDRTLQDIEEEFRDLKSNIITLM